MLVARKMSIFALKLLNQCSDHYRRFVISMTCEKQSARAKTQSLFDYLKRGQIETDFGKRRKKYVKILERNTSNTSMLNDFSI